MNIVDALKEHIFILPKKNDNESFIDLLHDTFELFLQTIEKIDEGTIKAEITKNLPTLKAFCNCLVQSVTSYYEGLPAKAYYEFEEAMNLIENNLSIKEETENMVGKSKPFYRARVGNSIQFSKGEMFHIPFHKREYATTNRFSIPGFPCLYLSSSIYVCWEELKRPDINKIQVSKFTLENKNFKILDISLTANSVIRYLESSATIIQGNSLIVLAGIERQESFNRSNKLSIKFLNSWPLVAACSIKVKKQDGAFKPEYIFPQFLLQWVTKNKKVDGIKYCSIEANISPKVDNSKLINYAIPVKKINTTGYCESLVDSFSFTEPVSWEILTMVNPSLTQHDQDNFTKNLPRLGFDTLIGCLELVKGKKIMYWHTIFGKIEIELADMELQKLTE